MAKDKVLVEFAEEYTTYRMGAVMPSTVMADGLALRKLCKHVGRERPLVEIRPRHGDTFISACTRAGLKATSTTNHFRHLHKAFETAKLWEYIEDNPFREVKPPRIFKAPPRFIPATEIGLFIAGIEDFDKRMFITALYATGRRRCELLGLRWADVDMDKREYRVHVSKVHRDTILPMSQLFRDVLIEQQMFHGHGEMVFPKWRNPDSVTHWVKLELVKGGYPDLHLHHLRHSFASAYVEAGGNIFTLSKLLTHSNVNTTQIYSHLTPGHLAMEVDRVKV